MDSSLRSRYRCLPLLPQHAQYPVAGLTATGRTLTIGAGSAWKVFIPDTYVRRMLNVADVIMHLHGDPQTVWNNAKWANLNAIIITANYGALSGSYQTPFSADTTLFQTALDQSLAAVRAQSDIPDNLQWDQLVLSSFSAGYGGVREILKSATYRNNIDDLVAADSLYASTASDGTPLDSQMVDYKTFALAAKNGQKTFLLSHSKVLTGTYENTIETADELMQYLGITPTAYSANGLGTLSYYRKAQAGNFRIWGANGDTADAHSAHLRYIGDFWEQLPIAKLIPGDFNLDGAVNAADYVLWRKKNGAAPYRTTAASLPASPTLPTTPTGARATALSSRPRSTQPTASDSPPKFPSHPRCFNSPWRPSPQSPFSALTESDPAERQQYR